MSTVRDLIKDALRPIGVLASGETPSADEISDALRVLNRMLDSWSIESLIVYTLPRVTVPVTAGKQVYTVGEGGDWDIQRPVRIQYVKSIQGDSETHVDLISYHEWVNISTKSVQSTIPTKIYLEGSFPLDSATLWPVPSVGGTIDLYVWSPLTRFTNASDQVEFPPGYEDAIVNNLATLLAPEYGVSAPPKIETLAMSSKEKIKRLNNKPKAISSNPMGCNRRFDIRTGE